MRGSLVRPTRRLAALVENEPKRFLHFPTKYDIHEYSIMDSFVDYLPPGRMKNELGAAIRGRGAFRRFKQTIRFHGIEQLWYDYQADAYGSWQSAGAGTTMWSTNKLEAVSRAEKRFRMKNILIIQGGGRPNGNTAQLVEHFARGAKEAGHTVEVISLRKQEVKAAWDATPVGMESLAYRRTASTSMFPKLRMQTALSLPHPYCSGRFPLS